VTELIREIRPRPIGSLGQVALPSQKRSDPCAGSCSIGSLSLWASSHLYIGQPELNLSQEFE